jgi:hypothetical protein
MTKRKGSAIGTFFMFGAFAFLMIILIKKFGNSDTPGYHYKKGYTDRNGHYHKPTTVRDTK